MQLRDAMIKTSLASKRIMPLDGGGAMYPSRIKEDRSNFLWINPPVVLYFYPLSIIDSFSTGSGFGSKLMKLPNKDCWNCHCILCDENLLFS